MGFPKMLKKCEKKHVNAKPSRLIHLNKVNNVLPLQNGRKDSAECGLLAQMLYNVYFLDAHKHLCMVSIKKFHAL